MLVGYTSSLSVHAGGRLQVMASSSAEDLAATLVRLRNAPRASRQEPLEESLPEVLDSRAVGTLQEIARGSYMFASLDGAVPCHSFSVTAWIYPTRIRPSNFAGVVSTVWGAGSPGVALAIDSLGELVVLYLESRGPARVVARSGVASRLREWYFVAVVIAANQVRLWQVPLSPWLDGESVRLASGGFAVPDSPPRGIFVGALAARRSGAQPTVVQGAFNGKIAEPSVWATALDAEALATIEAGSRPQAMRADRLLGAWDFSILPASTDAVDCSGQGRRGVLRGGPTRAVTGPRWSGSTLDYRLAPQEYNAVHFHEDDVEDAEWNVAFEVEMPATVPSGVYAVRLAAGRLVDRLPFVVAPRPGDATAAVALLLPTLTYLAYANRCHADEMLLTALRSDGSPDDAAVGSIRPGAFGLSLYDAHADGSQVFHASLRRPLLDVRPDHVNPVLGVPRHLPADMRLLAWLSTSGVTPDVLTDHDLHLYGSNLLKSHDVLVVGSHPEYCTREMLDAIESFVHHGGRVMYLGGNGFYAVASLSHERPHLVEVRRTLDSISFGRLEPGEGHASLTGEPGGIWRHRGRPPQRLVGIGATAWGLGRGAGYQRTPESYEPNVAWIFEGLEDAPGIGAGGPLGGAAGDELDRHDETLGSPPSAHVLATSRGNHPTSFEPLPEDRPRAGALPPPAENPVIRSDLVLVEAPSGGSVFSVGSIAWALALDQPDVSRVTANVLARFLTRDHREDVRAARTPRSDRTAAESRHRRRRAGADVGVHPSRRSGVDAVKQPGGECPLSESAVSVGGTTASDFEPLRTAFERNFDRSGDLGAAFHVVQHGRSVVDLWGGIADLDTRTPWTGNTAAMVFSGTKGLVATCILLLSSRSMLDVDAPVARYWPEFAKHGKREILVRHVLSHTAGLPGITKPVGVEQALDGQWMSARLAEQPATHAPGARLYYHALTYGWLCSEIVRRIDGRSLGRYFADEVAAPLSLDAWIGLNDRTDAHVARLQLAPTWGASPQLDKARAARDPLLYSIYHNPDLLGRESFPWNRRPFQLAEIPAVNAIASARAMAGLYGCLANEGTLDGVQLTSHDAVARSTSVVACGRDPYMDSALAFGLGFRLQLSGQPFGPVQRAFGHGGSGGSLHGAWPEHGLGFSYVTNMMRDDGGDLRAQRLLTALALCCSRQHEPA